MFKKSKSLFLFILLKVVKLLYDRLYSIITLHQETIKKIEIYPSQEIYFLKLYKGLVSFQTIWSIISDQCRISRPGPVPTRAGLVSTPLVCYQRPWSGIDTPSLLSETMV